jgi:hypothetical protein
MAKGRRSDVLADLGCRSRFLQANKLTLTFTKSFWDSIFPGYRVCIETENMSFDEFTRTTQQLLAEFWVPAD